MIDFFMAMQPPTKTFQDKIIARGRLINSPEIKAIAQKLMAHLGKHAPDEPMDGPICLFVIWVYQSGDKHPHGTMKTTKPDIDNIQKLLLDAMTKVKFWKDDSQISKMVVQKIYGDIPGIYISVEKIEL